MENAVTSVATGSADSERARARPRRRRKWIIVAVILGIAAFVPIRLDRLKKRLEASITASLGRRVSAQSIDFHLLPQPGFNLQNFTIDDDPAFSSEPLLRSDSVTANLRLRSLLGARIEIARLSVKEPSLNLVRNSQGRWNVESLLTRAAQIPSAPTGNAHAESRPRFPYIEADSGRINFKIGPEKKAFALTEADFSLWLASEDLWNMRLVARPIRSDANLGDTGTLKLSGSFQRSPDLHATPFLLQATWQKAQLGQLTHLIYGRDRGWRGAVTATAKLTGSPRSFDFTGAVSVDDFRRYDIASNDSLDFNINCNAMYRGMAAPNTPVQFDCTLPKDGGAFNLAGGLMPNTKPNAQPVVLSNLSLRAFKFPLSTVAAMARHMKKDMARELDATGFIDGTFFSSPGLHGDGIVDHDVETWTVIVSNIKLRSELLQPAVGTEVIAINFQRPIPDKTDHSRRPKGQIILPETQLTVTPFRIALGGPAPAVAGATFSRSNYHFEIKGDVDLERLNAFLASLGLPTPETDPVAKGRAKVDLTYSGAWSGFASPEVAGTVRPQTQTSAAIQ
ncbi:MAG TPA: AsmA family protein [Terriglobales bacterium]|nr:AsmA family protein [Terriglobales bacterium]